MAHLNFFPLSCLSTPVHTLPHSASELRGWRYRPGAKARFHALWEWELATVSWWTERWGWGGWWLASSRLPSGKREMVPTESRWEPSYLRPHSVLAHSAVLHLCHAKDWSMAALGNFTDYVKWKIDIIGTDFFYFKQPRHLYCLFTPPFKLMEFWKFIINEL